MTAAKLALEPKLGLANARSLAKIIGEHAGQDLTLDAAGTTQFGALGVQLLRATARSWAASGNELRLENVTDDAIDQLGVLGYTPESLTRWEGPA